MKIPSVAVALSVVVAAAVGAAPAAGASVAGPTSPDTRMQSNLRDLAVGEETYLTDHEHYGTAHQLRSDGWVQIDLRSAQVVIVHLDPLMGYCLAGRVAPHRFYVYDSGRGGLRGPRASDTCSTTTYPEYGGKLKP